MARDDVSTLALGALIALTLSPAFWPTGARASPEDRDEICAAYKGTSLWGQCTRAITHDCQDSALADPQCERWAQAWRDQTGDTEPPWLLKCGGGSSRCVFVTSSGHNGDLGGLAGADAICQGLADSSGSLAAHGTYKAWLSAAGTGNSAAERLAHATVPYKRVDGSTVADDWADLTDGSLDHPINITEGGDTFVCSGVGPFSNGCVWTSTEPDGSARITDLNPLYDSCGTWTNSTDDAVGWLGWPAEVSVLWTHWAQGPFACDQQLRLYCVQQ
jgi:hypothetical protein